MVQEKGLKGLGKLLDLEVEFQFRPYPITVVGVKDLDLYPNGNFEEVDLFDSP